MRALLVLLLLAAAANEARAQVAAQNPPVRKYRGFCFTPEHGEYKKLPEFTPFKSMADCLKSGGVLPSPKKPTDR